LKRGWSKGSPLWDVALGGVLHLSGASCYCGPDWLLLLGGCIKCLSRRRNGSQICQVFGGDRKRWTGGRSRTLAPPRRCRLDSRLLLSFIWGGAGDELDAWDAMICKFFSFCLGVDGFCEWRVRDGSVVCIDMIVQRSSMNNAGCDEIHIFSHLGTCLVLCYYSIHSGQHVVVILDNYRPAPFTLTSYPQILHPIVPSHHNKPRHKSLHRGDHT
jgi:hypothetical protein